MSVIGWIIIALLVIAALVVIGLLVAWLVGSDSSSEGDTPQSPSSGSGSSPTSTNPYLTVSCPTLNIPDNTGCTDLSYDPITGIVSGSCTDSAGTRKQTTLNMARCDGCNITSLNGILVCDTDYSACPSTVSVPMIDIGGNDLVRATVNNDENCYKPCTEKGCDFSTHNKGTCALKKTVATSGTDIGFSLTKGNGGTDCPTYYVVPNATASNQWNEEGRKDLANKTLTQCRSECEKDACDWYEYTADTGACRLSKGISYEGNTSIFTEYPVGLINY